MIKYILAFLAAGSLVLLWVVLLLMLPVKAVYRCDLAAFHPDYPTQVRAECRTTKEK
jgi:hypothetical protein